MEAYSKEFRREILAACDAGEGTLSVALRFEVSESWVRRVKQERREQGKVAPYTKRRRRKVWEPYAAWLLAKLDERPDIYLRESWWRRPKQNSAGKCQTSRSAGRVARCDGREKKDASTGRATPPRRRRGPSAMVRRAIEARSGPRRFCRRNMGQDEYEPHLWTQPAGNTSGRSGALRSLGDDDLFGSPAFDGFRRAAVC